MAVYFIQAGEGGPVKIGFARNIADRMKKIKSDNHEELRLVAAFVGDVADEISIHAMFSMHRLRGEWFRPDVIAGLGEVSLVPILALMPKAGDPFESLDAAGPRATMRLAEYLAAMRLRPSSFARQVGVSHTTVMRWASGEVAPSLDAMERIAAATAGRVMPNNFLRSPAAA